MEIIRIEDNDSGENTVHGYLKQLLLTLWREGEGFSGKRPFGNSGWKYDLYPGLIKIGAINGKLDKDGFIEEVDEKEAHEFIEKYIEKLFK